MARNLLGGREPTSIIQVNRDVRTWALTTAGLREHGTTHETPLKRFNEVEEAHLKALPSSPYDLAIWKKVKVYRDCYVSFEHAFYSVPQRLYPGYVWICGGTRQVRIYNLDYKLEATHERAQQAGERITNPEHIAPEILPGLTRTRESVLEEAEKIGPAMTRMVEELLTHPILDRLHTAGLLVQLAKKYSPERAEAACLKALEYGDQSYKTVKGILKNGLEKQLLPMQIELPLATTFARSSDEMVGVLAEVQTWN